MHESASSSIPNCPKAEGATVCQSMRVQQVHLERDSGRQDNFGEVRAGGKNGGACVCVKVCVCVRACKRRSKKVQAVAQPNRLITSAQHIKNMW